MSILWCGPEPHGECDSGVFVFILMESVWAVSEQGNFRKHTDFHGIIIYHISWEKYLDVALLDCIVIHHVFLQNIPDYSMM